MKLTEWDGRWLLKDIGILVPEGFLLAFETTQWPSERLWEQPQYLKAQVLQGRRGARGLVRCCDSLQDVARYLADMHQELTPDICAGFLCVPEQPHDQEWFLSCDLDRVTGQVRFHLGEQGGKDVAQVVTTLAEQESTSIRAELLPLARALMQALPRVDALSIEINPLIKHSDGSFVALDCKVELDDAAAFRHPEWKQFSDLSRWGECHSPCERAYTELLQKHEGESQTLGKYIELQGDVATIFAGGGASLLAMDSLIRAGGHPANYLELSGNPDPAFLKEAASIVFSRPGIRAVWIAGSFANFTDIHLTLQAILEAYDSSGLRVPIFVRRDGPSAEQAQQAACRWAKQRGLFLEFQRAECSLSESVSRMLEKIK